MQSARISARIFKIKRVLQCEFCGGVSSLPYFLPLAHLWCALRLFYLCRKGQQLEPSEQYIFSRVDGGRSMLTIRNIRQGDGGTYTCKATNKAGSQERELFLKVFGKYFGSHSNKADNHTDQTGKKTWHTFQEIISIFLWVIQTPQLTVHRNFFFNVW